MHIKLMSAILYIVSLFAMSGMYSNMLLTYLTATIHCLVSIVMLFILAFELCQHMLTRLFFMGCSGLVWFVQLQLIPQYY